MTIKNRFPDVAPVLNLDFANTKRLDPRITFTRASTGTYVDEFGVIRTAAANQARFDHDGNGNSLGLLVEESRTNLQTYSEDFSQWTITVSNSTPGASVSTNFATAPDGTTTADKFIPVNESFNYIRRGTITASNWSLTVYMKAAGMDYGQIAVGTAGNVRFNLANGTVVTETNATGQIQALANGWYRCTLVKTGFTSTTEFRIFPGDNSSSSQITTADGVKGILIWGAQAENATFATSYIPTSGSTATRSAEVANMTGTNFSSWYNQSEGTAVVKYKFLSQLQFTSPFAFRASTGVDVASWGYWTYTGGSQVRVPSFGKRTPNEFNTLLGTFFTLDTNRYYTVAVAQSGLSMSGCIETGTTQPLAITAMTTMNVLNFGWIRSTSQPMTGHIARLAYYDRRLTDAQLQALTL